MRRLLCSLAACAWLFTFGCAMDGAEPGAKVYKSACVACHGTGAAGAPRLSDQEHWRQRANQGLETLVSNALSGKGGMPAKGGNPRLSDEQVRQAVRYMLAQAGVSPS